ncbi:DUF397 domain-containing protein [Streptomyces sp. NBC_00828]
MQLTGRPVPYGGRGLAGQGGGLFCHGSTIRRRGPGVAWGCSRWRCGQSRAALELRWFKGSYSDSGNSSECVEMATTPACRTPLSVDLGQAPPPPVNSLMRTVVGGAGVTGVAVWRGIGRVIGMSWIWRGIRRRGIRTGCACCPRISSTLPMTWGMRCV